MIHLRRPSHVSTYLLCLFVFGLGIADSVHADERGSAKRKTPIKLRESSTYRPPAGVPQHLAAPAGLGSATNVSPQFYQQLGVQQNDRDHGTVVDPARQGTVYYVPRAVLPSLHGGFSPYAVGPTIIGVDPVPTEQDDRAYTEPPAPQAAPQTVVVVQAPPPTPTPAPAPPTVTRDEPVRASAEPAREKPRDPVVIGFQVSPADAEVHLDHDLLGTGSEVSALSDFKIKPGVYLLEVTHPDYPSQRMVFGANREPLEVVVDLSADRPQRRSRIR